MLEIANERERLRERERPRERHRERQRKTEKEIDRDSEREVRGNGEIWNILSVSSCSTQQIINLSYDCRVFFCIGI